MSSHAAVSASSTNFFHHNLWCTRCTQSVHKARSQCPLHPTHNYSLRWPFPGDVLAPGVRYIRRVWVSSSAFSSRGSNLRAICYLENVPHTLHGHICTSALTSLLFLTPPAAGDCYDDVTQAFKINLIVYLGLRFLPAFHVVFVCVYSSVKLDFSFCRDLFCWSYIFRSVAWYSRSVTTIRASLICQCPFFLFLKSSPATKRRSDGF